MRTLFFFKEEILDEVRKVCSDIFEKDKSFKFKIFKKDNWVLCIESKDRDTAFKRGMWFLTKVFKGKEDKLIKVGKWYFVVKK